jgi:hypothetical protein
MPGMDLRTGDLVNVAGRTSNPLGEQPAEAGN